MAYIIHGKTADWELVIGLETHMQILSEHKLFSTASGDYHSGLEPNTHVSDYDLCMDGSIKPALNRECVNQAIRMGLGLNAEISKSSSFCRKYYDYPDLPHGYQLTQLPDVPPVIGRGFVEVLDDDGNIKKITIQRGHLESDAAKIKIVNGEQLIDLNRYGVPLIEFVTDPCLSSPLEVENYLKELISIARALGVSRANMEDGNIRADINISLRPVGEKGFRTKTEIKNMVSFKFIKTAIEYEARRQIELYESGETVKQSTMHFDEDAGTTSVARLKEDAADYGYIPDNEVPAIIITDDEIEAIRATLPELPRAKMKRFITMGLRDVDAMRIADDVKLSDYFDAAVGDDIKIAKQVANWMLGELAANPDYEMSSTDLHELVSLINDGDISLNSGKDIFAKMVAGEVGTPKEIMEKFGLKQTVDAGAINDAIDAIITENSDKWAELKSGKDQLIGWFVGQIMKKMQGKGNPAMINECLAKKLKA
ncbi:MAG: Asp-tRNA(Asn)/Glu-tRNA(Gln) amidotransferase subunit GatB [Rickettsiales bacterium]|jgi:aspartyl-tRNA(Asn)/glutamyl-tRNA(Gln) amidotransferase subunit B|nr:Asp-tRNA(Asn)/Glu-tRNA(Gln) amidotransferase subunit GatB [Rickettsiales bacterium]